MLKLIEKNISLGENVLYVKGKNVKNSLTNQLKNNINITCLEVYENKKTIVKAEEKQQIINDTKSAAGIFFTCASNVERFFEIISPQIYTKTLSDKKIISIGEKCSTALKNLGLTNYIQSEDASYENMAYKI